MSQQDMQFDEMNSGRPGPSYGRYEGIHHTNLYGEKLSFSSMKTAPTAGQRLALAIASLAMLLVLIFGLIGIAASTQAQNWVIIPILFIYTLFATVAIIINIVFNRKV